MRTRMPPNSRCARALAGGSGYSTAAIVDQSVTPNGCGNFHGRIFCREQGAAILTCRARSLNVTVRPLRLDHGGPPDNLRCVPARVRIRRPQKLCIRGTVLIQSNSIGHARTALGCGALLATLANVPAWAADSALVPYRVENGQIRAPLTTEPGDTARGKAAVLSRDGGNCFLCHTVPDAGDTPLGNIGPPLAGVGRPCRLRTAIRLVDSRASISDRDARVLPDQGLRGVAPAYAGKPLLSPANRGRDCLPLTLRN